MVLFMEEEVEKDSLCQILDDDGYFYHMSGPGRANSGWFDAALILTPVAVPMLAGALYPTIETAYHSAIDLLANYRWAPADGGASQAQALSPLINGIVVPACSVALGTLTALTISQLRQRQIQLRTLLNKEACLIRCILSTFEALFQGERQRGARQRGILLLRQYTSRVLAESRYGVDVGKLEKLGASDSELDGVLRHLAFTPRLGEGEAGGPNVPTAFASPTVVRELMMASSSPSAAVSTLRRALGLSPVAPPRAAASIRWRAPHPQQPSP